MLLSNVENPYQGEPDLVFPQCCILLQREAFSEGAKAQLKKVIEWGNEPCWEHGDAERRIKIAVIRHRRNCTQCWQSLLKEIE